MGKLDGYKGSENIENQSGIDNIPQSFESIKNESQNELNSLKDSISGVDIQLNNKKEEVIDTFIELSGNELLEEEKEELNSLLKDLSKKSLDTMLSYLKEYGEGVTIDDFKDISLIVSDGEEIVSNGVEIVSEEEKKEEVKEEKEEVKVEKEEVKVEKEEVKVEKEEVKVEKEEVKVDVESLNDKIKLEKSKNENEENIADELSKKMITKDNNEIKKGILSNKEKEKQLERENNISSLKLALVGLDGNNKPYGKVIDDINSFLDNDNSKKDEYQAIIEELHNDNTFLAIANDLKQKDPKQYDKFKSTLIDIDSTFIGEFERYESKVIPAKQQIALGINNIDSVDISKNTLHATKDGLNITVGKDGRKLGLLDGDGYMLDSDIDNSESMKKIIAIENDLQNELKGINETLNTVGSILKYIDDAISNEIEIEEVKEKIKTTNIDLYNELHIESASTLYEIKQNLTGLYKQKEEEKNKIIKAKRLLVEKIIENNTVLANGVDSSKRETLKYLDDIGFSFLPQSLTDQILNDYIANSLVIPGLNLNNETIDLKNARFGEGATEEGGDAWKDNLVMFMEKMIYGEIGGDNSVFKGKNFKGSLGSRIDPLELNQDLLKNGIKSSSGTSWNINAIRDNLKKEVK